MVKRQDSVFVIILNWNGWEDTLDCLSSLEHLDYQAYEVVVVDNGSTDGSEEKIREAYPDVVVLQTGENLGFAGGNNAGIRYALERGADHVWLLNNDAVVHPGSLTPLVKEALSEASIGMVGSKINYYQDPDVIWFAGGTIDPLTGKTGHSLMGKKDTGGRDEPRDVDYASACSLLVTRGVLEDVGLMDTRFFLYFEETDWAARCRRRGWRVRYQPASKIWHKVSRASKLDSPGMIFHFTRSSMLFARKHISSRPVLPLIVVSRHHVLPFLARGKMATALAGIRGLWSGLTADA
jgi:GT2 family glycosyltransferase